MFVQFGTDLTKPSNVIRLGAETAAAELLDNDAMAAAGTLLGPYRIEGELGAGGMGQVYRARDTRLDRLVAIKVSKEEFNERFEREARAVAALNHPNVCSLYDVGPNYLVMELVEGPTLAERIKQGPIGLEEALVIARQMADALEAAHEKGIIHRDLKPGNIKVKPDGTVKVLDFGLAKHGVTANAPASDPGNSPTLTVPTGAGMILGTASYMSPEQARGQAVDKRADIWAFGVVLYEMLSGQRLFEGSTVSDTLAAVLTKDPDLGAIPQQARRLLRRCLEKDPRRRLRDIGDAWELIEGPAPAGATAASARQARRLQVVASVATLALAALGVYHYQATRPVERPLVRFDVNLGANAEVGMGGSVIFSPDGTRIVFSARAADGRRYLHARQLDQPQAALLAGTEDAESPFFAPDGRWVAFFAGGKLKKVSVEGGAAMVLCDAAQGRGGSWGDDGYIVAALSPNSLLWRVSSAGGTPAALTTAGPALEISHRWPQILPGGDAVLFSSPRRTGVDNSAIEAQSLVSGKRKTLYEGGTFARYLPSGHLVFVHGGTMFAAPMDLARLELTGPVSPVLEDVSTFPSGSAAYDVSQTGTLIYQSGKDAALRLTIQWLDSAGKTQPLLAKPADYSSPAISPDGKQLAIVVAGDLWVNEWQSGRMIRLTSTTASEYTPVWAPDGRHIAYGSPFGVWWVRADGSGAPHRLTDGGSQFPQSITRDGKRLAYVSFGEGTASDIWILPLAAGGPDQQQSGKPEPFLRTPSTERNAAFSPDGRWMAYNSDESGQPEVYVRYAVGGVASSSGKSPVSIGGGRMPVWSRSGREIFYRTLDDRIMVAGYMVKGEKFSTDEPRLWSETRLLASEGFRNFDLAPDGQRFAAVMAAPGVAQAPPGQVSVLLNFFDELKRRVPGGR